MPMPDETTQDKLLGGRVQLTQPAAGFRAGIDPIFLAAAVPAAAGEKVLEVGCGSGAASLCLAARVEGAFVTGLDSDRALVRLAGVNADSNGFAGRVQFFVGDLLAPPIRLAAASFDHVMANPPFRPVDTGQASPDPARAAAMVEGKAGLEDWLRFSLMMTRHTGTITFIYAADRLDALLASLYGRVGGITIFPLWPTPGRTKPAKRVLVIGRRGAKGPLTLMPGLVLHRPDGSYTEEAESVLRHGKAIDW